ncbi:sulfurtransferase TusA family protein [soil metagenome]
MTISSSSSLPPTSLLPGDVDLRGEVCPFTFVRTKLALEGVAIGESVSVIVDHEPAARTIPRSAREWGQEVLGVEALDGAWRISIRRNVR